jgi:sterol desaturase/sphingolipid hydroxylase (fatty acid hydroxylase superfamily)
VSDLRALADSISAIGPAGRVTLACYLVILIAVVVDLAVTGLHREPLPRARVVSLFVTISVALVLAPPFAWIVALLWSALERVAPPSLVHVWSALPALAFIACFVVVDAVAYLYHWVGHHSRVGWASHRVHHLGETFDMTLVLRQPWLPVHGLVIIPLTALAGFSFEIAAACSSISIAYQALQHSSRSWSLGRWDAVLVSGRAHRRHHVVDSGAVNLGMVFSVWDRALGTWRGATVDDDATYGIGEPEPVSALAVQVDGWRRAAATRPVPRPSPLLPRRSRLQRALEVGDPSIQPQAFEREKPVVAVEGSSLVIERVDDDCTSAVLARSGD